MGQWRCSNKRCATNPQGPLGFDFEAPVGTCPKCGASIDDPRTGRFMARIMVTHYDPPHPTIDSLGTNLCLCDPNKHVGRLHLRKEQATGDPNAVTCRACLEHAEFPKDGIDERKRVPLWVVGETLPENAGRSPLVSKPRVALGTPRGG